MAPVKTDPRVLQERTGREPDTLLSQQIPSLSSVPGPPLRTVPLSVPRCRHRTHALSISHQQEAGKVPDKCHMPCHSATVLLGSSGKTDRQQARPHEASRAGKRICKAECWPGEGLSSRADGKPGQAGISPWGALGLEGSRCSSGPTVRADSRAKRGPERGLPVPGPRSLAPPQVSSCSLTP